MSSQTPHQYQQVIGRCRDVFAKKTQDYGTAWRVLRLPSLTDQLFIKAQRIRSIQEKGVQKVADDVAGEFVGIVNYCIIALIQNELPAGTPLDLPPDQVLARYDEQVRQTLALQADKNHDYAEAWRDMRISSMTDIILMKLYRTKQIEDNHGVTVASEGVEANYRDMINYAVFCLIKMGFHETGGAG